MDEQFKKEIRETKNMLKNVFEELENLLGPEDSEKSNEETNRFMIGFICGIFIFIASYKPCLHKDEKQQPKC